jgi:hypothetical protein
MSIAPPVWRQSLPHQIRSSRLCSHTHLFCELTCASRLARLRRLQRAARDPGRMRPSLRRRTPCHNAIRNSMPPGLPCRMRRDAKAVLTCRAISFPSRADASAAPRSARLQGLLFADGKMGACVCLCARARVCVIVCVYVCACACTNARARACVHACVCVCVTACARVRSGVHARLRACEVTCARK